MIAVLHSVGFNILPGGNSVASSNEHGRVSRKYWWMMIKTSENRIGGHAASAPSLSELPPYSSINK
jgi:hypothetical protein